jgi:ABC-type nitrate/sulfonate/bicarbonate transport system permease component
MNFFRSLPPVALIPLFLFIFGIGTKMQVAIIYFSAVWPVVLNTVDGVRATDPILLDVAKVYRLSGWRRVGLTLHSATPQIFVGARIALAIALIVMVVSEMVGSTNGIGYVILQAQREFKVADMWAGILVIALVGLAVNILFVAIERRALRWQRGHQATDEE